MVFRCPCARDDSVGLPSNRSKGTTTSVWTNLDDDVLGSFELGTQTQPQIIRVRIQNVCGMVTWRLTRESCQPCPYRYKHCVVRSFRHGRYATGRNYVPCIYTEVVAQLLHARAKFKFQFGFYLESGQSRDKPWGPSPGSSAIPSWPLTGSSWG